MMPSQAVVVGQGSQKSIYGKMPAIAEYEQSVWPYRLILPFMFVIGTYVQAKKFLFRRVGGDTCIPNTNSWLFDGISINGRRVKDGAARWPALDAVYNFRKGEGSNPFIRAIDSFWLCMRNAQAVRNRLVIVKRELIVAVKEVAETKVSEAPVRILSIAAGSGQGVIEAVKELRRSGIRCEIMLVDQDESALRYARVLASQHGVSDSIITHKGDAVSFYRGLQEGWLNPDIIEMCGLMDYLRETLAIALIKKVRRYLKPDGFFITCHIHPNTESYFLRHAINWDMLYRTREEFQDLLIQGGFLAPKIHTEPLQIHSVAVAQKML